MTEHFRVTPCRTVRLVWRCTCGGVMAYEGSAGRRHLHLCVYPRFEHREYEADAWFEKGGDP